MIETITVTNHFDESLTMELRFPEKSGFLIRSIDGLGPGKATINTSEATTSDGTIFNSSKLGARNIVLNILLLENPTIEDSRLSLYKYFPVKTQVKLRVKTTNRIGEIYGYVESNEPLIFSDQESTVISIICTDPYFYYPGEDTNLFNGVEPLFEFPFSNESLTEDLLIISSVEPYTRKVIINTGDAPVGMLMYITAIGSVTNLAIENTRTQEIMRISNTRLVSLTGSGITSGDTIIISTIKGRKSITLLRDGLLLNILNALDVGAGWFQLEKGKNMFVYDADDGMLNIQFRTVNQIAYEGV
jgi:Phage tail protein